MKYFESAWQFVKEGAEWIYLAAFLALGGWAFSRGAWVEGLVDVGIGVAMWFVMRWLRPRTPVTVDIAVDLSKRGKAIPYEGSPEWLNDHRREMPDCSLCKMWGWDKL